MIRDSVLPTSILTWLGRAGSNKRMNSSMLSPMQAWADSLVVDVGVVLKGE
ncbi:MAG: hypothetical protein ISR45_10675 [Rhodospirillales bacterium]|nr:hypothetical protein [Rhodospirillales bacterium]